MEYIVSERFTRFLYKRNDAIALGFGLTNDHLGAAPPDIVKLERSEFFVAQSGGGDQQQDGAVPYADRCGHVERIDRAPDICPRQPGWQVSQPIARRMGHETGKILVVEAGPP